MKRIKFLLIVTLCLLLACFAFCGCTQENPADTQDDTSAETDENNEAANTEEDSFTITNELLKEAEASMLEALSPLPEKGNGEKIGAIAFSMTNPFWVTVQEGYEDAAKEYGVSVDVVASPNEADEQGQADAMTALLAKDYDAFAVSAMTPFSLVNPVAEATSRGIKVVAVGTNIDEQAAKDAGAKVEAFVTSDFEAQGKLGASYIMELLGGSGKVAVIEGQAGADNSEQRKNGAIAGFEENGGEIVAVEAANWDRQTAYDIATNILQANPDLQGIMCANDEMALGVVEAMKAAGVKDQVKVVGIDFIEEAKTSIENGELDGSVVMSPYLFGKAGLILALKAVQGHEITEDMFWTPFALVNADNVDQYDGWK
ncbi:MAG: substrate-binding domain-containing protein [Firmicutes bacterium]|nr:substrate-binding domain-containing protein [Bacillota bacterium]